MIETDSPDYQTQGRIRTAARLAPNVYPGAVGELISYELDAWADLSFLWVSGAGSKRMRELGGRRRRAWPGKIESPGAVVSNAGAVPVTE